MGYSIRIKSKNPITENNIDNFILQLDKLYNPYTEYFDNIKQDNKYTLFSDLIIENDYNIIISGCYGISDNIVDGFIREFKSYFCDKKLKFDYLW